MSASRIQVMPAPCNSTSPVASLQTLSVKQLVRMLFTGAEGGEDEYLKDALGVIQNLGLFADVFCHSMRYLQQQYETQRAYSSNSSRSHNSSSQGGSNSQLRRSSSTSLALECVISRLLPGLFHPKMTALSLKYDFVRHSAHARAITLTSIRHLRNLERADLSGVCTDELAAQLSLHCPRLRHLCASGSRQLTDAALAAVTGALRLGGGATGFLPGCKRLRRLEIAHCPLITVSKVVSVLLTLPEITHIAYDKLSQVFESSALFECGLTFGLTNFEHVVTHLERAREKINHHLRSEDQFVLKVSEIFPCVSSVKLVLSHLFDDSSVLRQVRHFAHLRTLVLEQPVGSLDWSLRHLLLERGDRLEKLSLRVHSASLMDLVWVLRACPRLKIFRFFAMLLEAALEDDFSLRAPSFAAEDMDGLAEICLGCAKTVSAEDDAQQGNGNGNNNNQGEQNVDANNNNDDGEDGDVFLEFFRVVACKARRLRSLVLSGDCSQWADDRNVNALLDAGALASLRRLVVTSKSNLSQAAGKRLTLHCPDLQQVRIFGWNTTTSSSSNSKCHSAPATQQ